MTRLGLVINGKNPQLINISKYSEVCLSLLYFRKSILMSSTMNTSFPLLFNLSNRCFGVSRKCSRSFDGCR